LPLCLRASQAVPERAQTIPSRTIFPCCPAANGYNAPQFAGGNMLQRSGQFDAQSRLTAGGAAVSFGHRPDHKKAP